jgi:imidazolonepropionase
VGSIEVGKKADLVIWNVQSYKEILYHFGVNLVEQVIKERKVISEKI